MEKSIFKIDNGINEKKIIKECEKYEYVSFDVYDTLIKRNLNSPLEVFNILNEYAKKMKIKNFKNIRIETENEIRKNKGFVTIFEIYKSLERVIGIENSQKLLAYEIETEINYSQPNYPIKKIFEILQLKGKKIVAISDMYLTTDIIRKILYKCGYNIKKIYVSCQCKAKKSDGSLFKYALKEQKIKENLIIHIGDNLKADFIGAKIAKIKAIHITNKIEYFNDLRIKNKIDEKEKYNVYKAIINNNLINESDYFKKFGFALVGPLIYNYCIWLKDNCVKNNIKNIYFFSRDGFILKKVFDDLYPNLFLTHYIYISRRSIRIPYSSNHCNFDEFVKYMPMTKVFTVDTFFKNLGLDVSKYNDILNKYKFSINDLIYYDDLFKDNKFQKIFEELKEDILKESQKEKQLLIEYLRQEDFEGKIAIVDIGWHNSIQFYLEDIASNENINLDLFGFYLGLQPNEKKVKNAVGYIVDEKESIYAQSVKAYIGLIESLFLADEGSTKAYIKTHNEIKPILFDYEYEKNDMEYKSFRNIKEGIYDYIKIIKNLNDFELYKLSGYDSFSPLRIYGVNPYLRDVKIFSKFRYLSEEISYFSNAKSVYYYIFHFREFKLDFFKSRWKIGFMKELFKIKLPYYKIYLIYKKKKGWK